MILALTDLAGTMFELIESEEGESIYTEHLDEHGEGLHHVACFAFEDTEKVVDNCSDISFSSVELPPHRPSDR